MHNHNPSPVVGAILPIMPAHNTRSHKKVVRFVENPLESSDVFASDTSGSTRSAAASKGASKSRSTATGLSQKAQSSKQKQKENYVATLTAPPVATICLPTRAVPPLRAAISLPRVEVQLLKAAVLPPSAAGQFPLKSLFLFS